MSVLIKGMALPENCFYCVIMQKTDDGKYMKCPLIGFKYSMHDMYTYVSEQKEPHPECPLVDLGKNGRLIDADAFKTEYGMKNDCADCEKEMHGKVKACEYDRIYSKMDFCGWLDDAPTVIEAEDE